jgi:hypothetical protein
MLVVQQAVPVELTEQAAAVVQELLAQMEADQTPALVVLVCLIAFQVQQHHTQVVVVVEAQAGLLLVALVAVAQAQQAQTEQERQAQPIQAEAAVGVVSAQELAAQAVLEL